MSEYIDKFPEDAKICYQACDWSLATVFLSIGWSCSVLILISGLDATMNHGMNLSNMSDWVYECLWWPEKRMEFYKNRIDFQFTDLFYCRWVTFLSKSLNSQLLLLSPMLIIEGFSSKPKNISPFKLLNNVTWLYYL